MLYRGDPVITGLQLCNPHVSYKAEPKEVISSSFWLLLILKNYLASGSCIICIRERGLMARGLLLKYKMSFYLISVLQIFFGKFVGKKCGNYNFWGVSAKVLDKHKVSFPPPFRT